MNDDIDFELNLLWILRCFSNFLCNTIKKTTRAFHFFSLSIVVVVVVITNTVGVLVIVSSMCYVYILYIGCNIHRCYTNCISHTHIHMHAHNEYIHSQVPSSTHSMKKKSLSQIFSLSIRKCLHTQGKLTFVRWRKSAKICFNMNATKFTIKADFQCISMLVCFIVHQFIRINWKGKWELRAEANELIFSLISNSSVMKIKVLVPNGRIYWNFVFSRCVLFFSFFCACVMVWVEI